KAVSGPVRGDVPFTIATVAATVLVAAIAFSASYQHQYELAIHYGQTHWVAGMMPLSVDLLIVAAGLVIWYAARHGYPRPVRAYVALGGGVAATVIANLAADHRYIWPWLGPGISVWPALAFFAAYEMAVWLAQKRQSAQPAEGEEPAAQSAPGVPRDNLDAAIQAMILTHAAGNGHSARGLATRFELPPKLAGKVRQLVLAEA